MTTNNCSSISTNYNFFSNEHEESLYDSLYSNDSNKYSDEEISILSSSSFLELLLEINERVNDNLQKKSVQPTSRRPNFIVDKNDKKNKRGKQNKKNSKKPVHNSSQFDNLQRKIQVHFFTFVIDFCNDALKKEFEFANKSFKNINYDNKTTINFEYTFSLRKLCIKDLLKMKISKKFKRIEITYNEDLLKNIESSSSWLTKLFQMNYLELFSYYYNSRKPLDKIVFENEEIILSKKTRSFYYLLEKYKNLKKNLINTAEIVYFDGKENYEGPFSTEG